AVLSSSGRRRERPRSQRAYRRPLCLAKHITLLRQRLFPLYSIFPDNRPPLFHSLIFALRRRHGTRILRKGSPVFPPRGVRQTSRDLPTSRHRTGADPFPPRDLCPPVTREYRRPPTGNTLCRLRVIGDIRQSRTKVGCLQRRFLPGPTKGLPQRPGRAARPA